LTHTTDDDCPLSVSTSEVEGRLALDTEHKKARLGRPLSIVSDSFAAKESEPGVPELVLKRRLTAAVLVVRQDG
jgi:hypothetical protein